MLGKYTKQSHGFLWAAELTRKKNIPTPITTEGESQYQNHANIVTQCVCIICTCFFYLTLSENPSNMISLFLLNPTSKKQPTNTILQTPKCHPIGKESKKHRHPNRSHRKIPPEVGRRSCVFGLVAFQG